MADTNFTIISNEHAQTPNTLEPWLLLLKIAIPENTKRPAAYLYVCDNDTNVEYQGNTYYAFAFNFPSLNELPGQLPTLDLQVTNVDRTAHKIFEDFTGATGGIATMMVVSANDLEGSSPAQTYTFEIMNAFAEEKWATVTLGAPSPMRRAFTTLIFTVDHCQWIFNSPLRRAALDPRGAACKYRGALPTCDHTLNGSNGCKAHGNQSNFGAHPGIGTQGFRFASVT